MNDPYLTLGVALDADDATIRVAYLAGIRRYPPDLEPERFAALRAAFEGIADDKARRRYRLLNEQAPTPADLLAALMIDAQPAPLTEATIKQLLVGRPKS